MSYDYVKSQPIRLREAGKDEKWLQELIAADPAILGFGEVILIQRERSQPTGGRVDLILADADPDEKLRYEVEVMLGPVDESHIIRTIEYWDIERKRYPSYNHRAVIVAEEITNRFFNVIGLLNKAIPIVAIQMNAFLIDGKLCLNFVRVLDVIESAEADDEGETVDRGYWVRNNRTASLEVMDAVIKLLPNNRSLRIKYNQGHIAVGTTGTNFLWFYPRKGNYVLAHIDVGEEFRGDFLTQLKSKGIECAPSPRHPSTLHFSPTLDDVARAHDVLGVILGRAESWSRE
ncbi:MAG: hypothetical protein NDI75_13135 [Candidatus Didemnitutus sp.]|nr:hypothetical protein [Candidatus Didemnitutus sp.]